MLQEFIGNGAACRRRCGDGPAGDRFSRCGGSRNRRSDAGSYHVLHPTIAETSGQQPRRWLSDAARTPCPPRRRRPGGEKNCDEAIIHGPVLSYTSTNESFSVRPGDSHHLRRDFKRGRLKRRLEVHTSRRCNRSGRRRGGGGLPTKVEAAQMATGAATSTQRRSWLTGQCSARTPLSSPRRRGQRRPSGPPALGGAIAR